VNPLVTRVAIFVVVAHPGRSVSVVAGIVASEQFGSVDTDCWIVVIGCLLDPGIYVSVVAEIVLCEPFGSVKTIRGIVDAGGPLLPGRRVIVNICRNYRWGEREMA
jgi:hypothetical protein